MLKVLVTAIAGLGIALSAAAAEAPNPNSTLREMAGKVSISQGKDFAPAKADLRLKPGDQLRTQAESSATVIFDDGCRVDIEANKLFRVAEQSICACRMLAEQRKAKGEAPGPNSTMSKMEGQVSVNAGDEFAPAQPEMRLKPGDRVMTQAKSAATIVFDDKCRLNIAANKLVTVPEQSVCACGLLVEQGLTPAGASAIGAAASNTGVGIMAATVTAIDIWALQDEENNEEDTVSP